MPKDISYKNWKMTYDKWHLDSEDRGAGGEETCGYCKHYGQDCELCPLNDFEDECICDAIGSSIFDDWLHEHGPKKEDYANKIFNAIVEHGEQLGYCVI